MPSQHDADTPWGSEPSDSAPDRPPRALGAWPATALVAGQMLGVGIFLGPPIVAGYIPDSTGLLLLWICGGIAALCGALTLAELGAMAPRSGGYYVIVRRVYGPAAGFATGWLQMVAVFPGSIATVALALGEYQLPAIFGESVREPFLVAGLAIPSAFVFAAIVVIALTAINHVGIVVSGRVQLLLTGTPIFVFFLATIVILAMGWHGPETAAAAATPADVPAAEVMTLAGVAAAYMPVYFAFAGWDGAIYVAGEIERPGRTLPLALIGGTLCVTLLYLVLCLGFVSVFSMDQLARAGEAGTAVASTLFGRPGVLVITSLIVLGMLGSLNGQVLAGSRIAYAMGFDGLFLDRAGRLHRTYLTPVTALWLQAAWTLVLIATGGVARVMSYATSAMLIIGILMVPAILFLRHRDPGVARPYRTLGYPLTPVLYVVSSLAVLVVLIVKRDPSTWASALWFAGAFVIYWLFFSSRVRSTDD